MPVVDLSILRCATYEMLYLTDVDPAITINEAVEIAKSYSTPDSPKFHQRSLGQYPKKTSQYTGALKYLIVGKVDHLRKNSKCLN